MIDYYGWPTPNGYKISIALEEMGLDYRPIAVDIGAGDQFDPAFLAISPNNKIPAIVDHDAREGAPFALFESGAILVYLAEKSGAFLPSDFVARYRTLEWLMFQMGGAGPMLGQTHHFRNYAPEPIAYAINRYTSEATRLYRVIDRRLSQTEFVAGDYSIADMALFPWIRMHQRQGQVIADFPHVERWLAAIAARPAVQRGLGLMSDRIRKVPLDAANNKVLFGEGQFARR